MNCVSLTSASRVMYARRPISLGSHQLNQEFTKGLDVAEELKVQLEQNNV